MEVKFEHRLTEAEEKLKSHQHQIDEIKKRQGDLEELTTTVRVLATREENVENTVKEIKEDVKTLTDKPAKRWETIITAVITGVVGFLLAHFGF